MMNYKLIGSRNSSRKRAKQGKGCNPASYLLLQTSVFPRLTTKLHCPPVPALHTEVLLHQLKAIVSFEEIREFLKFLWAERRQKSLQILVALTQTFWDSL